MTLSCRYVAAPRHRSSPLAAREGLPRFNGPVGRTWATYNEATLGLSSGRNGDLTKLEQAPLRSWISHLLCFG
jgi:hypothetical protein